MKICAGQVVLLTGASGGIGEFIAREFARLGLDLVLNAYPGAGLEAVRKEAELLGVRAVSVASDLREPGKRRELVREALAAFGRVDILVNNAGVEFNSEYHGYLVQYYEITLIILGNLFKTVYFKRSLFYIQITS